MTAETDFAFATSIEPGQAAYLKDLTRIFTVDCLPQDFYLDIPILRIGYGLSKCKTEQFLF